MASSCTVSPTWYKLTASLLNALANTSHESLRVGSTYSRSMIRVLNLYTLLWRDPLSLVYFAFSGVEATSHAENLKGMTRKSSQGA